MLWMEHHRLQGMKFGFNITAAVLFSAWLDLTASNPTYDRYKPPRPPPRFLRCLFVLSCPHDKTKYEADYRAPPTSHIVLPVG